MMISIRHRCGHTAHHVVYGPEEQIAAQRESLRETQCPDCFHDKVLRLTASNVSAEIRRPLSRRR